LQFSSSKREERRRTIQELPPQFHEAIVDKDEAILRHSVAALVEEVRAGRQDPVEILTAYGKKALNAHEETNCLTEVMIGSAVNWAKGCDKSGVLAGIPVSLKDVSVSCVAVMRNDC